jgi:hypothetical protein
VLRRAVGGVKVTSLAPLNSAPVEESGQGSKSSSQDMHLPDSFDFMPVWSCVGCGIHISTVNVANIEGVNGEENAS